MLAASVACGVVASLVVATARPVSATTTVPGGVTLDRSGGLHPFGAFTLDTSGAASWPGRDVARSLVVLSDGTGGWTLDGFGSAHAFGAAPALSGTPTFGADDIARALVVLPDEHSGYVLDGWGGIHPFGGAPALHSGAWWPGQDFARGFDVHLNSSGAPDGGAVLDAYGTVHIFGNYPYSLSTSGVYANRFAYQALHSVGGHVYAVGKYGRVVEKTSGGGMSPLWTNYGDYGQQDSIRDVVLTSAIGGSGPQPMSAMAQYAWQQTIAQRGGAWVDAWGGLHTFGGLSLNTAGAGYWKGWDMARSLALRPNGSGGWVLDGWGGIHPFGGAPRLSSTSYWKGSDVARALVVNPDGASGYLLDSWGGLHPFGGAPALHGYPYWYGWSIARGLAIHYDAAGTPDGGWTLDGWGGIHPFGAAGSLQHAQWWPGHDVYLNLHATYNGDPYRIARFGGFTDMSAFGMKPYWSGYSDPGSWDMLRDLTLVGDDNVLHSTAQPESSAASNAFMADVWTWSFNVSPVQQGLPLDCESAALEEATRAKGHDVSQYTIFDSLPNNDRGPAQMSGGNVVRWGDPYTEFVGNVYGCEPCGTGYGVYDPPLVSVARSLGFNAVGIENGSPTQVYDDIALGRPVLIITSDTFTPVGTRWWTAYDGRSVPYSFYDHAVTIVAENGVAGTITINDVADGRFKTFTMSQFASFWTAYLDMAVVLQ